MYNSAQSGTLKQVHAIPNKAGKVRRRGKIRARTFGNPSSGVRGNPKRPEDNFRKKDSWDTMMVGGRGNYCQPLDLFGWRLFTVYNSQHLIKSTLHGDFRTDLYVHLQCPHDSTSSWTPHDSLNSSSSSPSLENPDDQKASCSINTVTPIQE